MYREPEDVKQLIVLIILAIAMFIFIFTKQADYADNIITAFIAIMANNSIVKERK